MNNARKKTRKNGVAVTWPFRCKPVHRHFDKERAVQTCGVRLLVVNVVTRMKISRIESVSSRCQDAVTRKRASKPSAFDMDNGFFVTECAVINKSRSAGR